MLKHRQEGLVFLHGLALVVAVSAAFLGLAFSLEALKFVKFTDDVNWSIYLVGLLGAMVWIQHGLRVVGPKLGALKLWDAVRLSSHQVTRIMAVLFTLAFVTRDLNVSRTFLVGFVILASVVLLLGNLFLPNFLSNVFFSRQRLRTVVVSSPGETRELKKWFAARHHLGVDLIGYVAPSRPTSESDARDLLFLGRPDELRQLLIEYNADQIVVSQAQYPGEHGERITKLGELAGCRVRSYVNLRSLFSTEPLALEHDSSYAFATWTPEPLDNPTNRVIKRVFDITVALPVVFFVMPPLTVFVWAIQRFQSKGPVFYRQMRSGLNRERFYIYKFRTMRVEGEAANRAKQATQNDSRIYPLGRFLRKSSLDEVPQFLNVLIGEMSVSGPRPHLIEHDEAFSKIVASYHKRHFVKPGITGLAQSKGFRGEVTEPALLEKRIEHDMHYVSKWSLGLDLRILFDTAVQIVFPPKSAY